MRQRNLASDIEAKSGARRLIARALSAVEAIENLRMLFWKDLAVASDTNGNLAIHGPRTDVHSGTGPRIPACVFDQLFHRQAKELGIGFDSGEASGNLASKFSLIDKREFVICKLLRFQVEFFGKQLWNVHRLQAWPQLFPLQRGHAQEAGCQFAKPGRFRLDYVRELHLTRCEARRPA